MGELTGYAIRNTPDEFMDIWNGLKFIQPFCACVRQKQWSLIRQLRGLIVRSPSRRIRIVFWGTAVYILSYADFQPPFESHTCPWWMAPLPHGSQVMPLWIGHCE